MFNFLMPVTRNKVLVGTVAAMLGATCYGSSQFLVRQIVTTHDIPPLIIATYALLFGLIVLTTLSQNTIKQDRRAPMRGFIFMALAGLTASVGVGFNYSALGIAPVVIVAPVSAASPLISLALAHLFLQRLEKITFRIWMGTLLVVGGVILVTLGSAS